MTVIRFKFLLIGLFAGHLYASDGLDDQSSNGVSHWQAEWKNTAIVSRHQTNSVERLQQGTKSSADINSLRLLWRYQWSNWQLDLQHLSTVSIASESLAQNHDSAIVSAGSSSFATGNLINGNRLVWPGSSGQLSAKAEILQSLERASLSYSSEHSVVRVGRQAISWGNGAVFQTFDLLNPFSPDTLDSSYKPGADMVYGQYLFDSGADLQWLWLPRSAAHNKENIPQLQTRDKNSFAAKYLFFQGETQFELLFAEDYGNRVFGGSMVTPLGQSLVKWDTTHTRWQADCCNQNNNISMPISSAESEDLGIWQSVINWQYSWTFDSRPMSGFIEYYFNQLAVNGEQDLDFSVLSAIQLAAVSRGQLFSVRKNNIAAGLQWQLTEQQMLSPTIISSLNDSSLLLLLNWQMDLGDHSNLLAGIQWGVGDKGSMYGGSWFNQSLNVTISPIRQGWLRYEYYW